MRLGENPYIFLYYELHEILEDFYQNREDIMAAADLLRQGKGVKPDAGGGDGDAAAAEPAEEPDVKPYDGVYELFVDRKAPPLPTLLGYMNVTEEDESVWDPTNHIRLCLQVWETDSS